MTRPENVENEKSMCRPQIEKRPKKKKNHIILVWPTSWTPVVGGLFVCVCDCLSAEMTPYCSAHDEWLIMKRCVYVGYHDDNNVSNFSGDPVTQLNLKTF